MNEIERIDNERLRILVIQREAETPYTLRPRYDDVERPKARMSFIPNKYRDDFPSGGMMLFRLFIVVVVLFFWLQSL